MHDVVALQTQKTYSLADIQTVAAGIVGSFGACNVILLRGEMGSGKTTLVKAIAAHLGVKAIVASPTFSIINEYVSTDGRRIYHFDFYRIKNETEAYDMGVEEYFESGDLCLVEWPEKIPSLLPSEYFEIHLNAFDAHKREIKYGKH